MLQVIHPLLDVTFSEESSDEEYNPTADMSEEESEGEESEEERGDTPLCNAGQAEVPPIEEEQDGVKSTGMYVRVPVHIITQYFNWGEPERAPH